MGLEGRAKRSSDGKPCTRRNQIIHFARERVKLQLALVSPFFLPFPFRPFYAASISSAANFLSLSLFFSRRSGDAFRRLFRYSYNAYEIFHRNSAVNVFRSVKLGRFISGDSPKVYVIVVRK